MAPTGPLSLRGVLPPLWGTLPDMTTRLPQTAKPVFDLDQARHAHSPSYRTAAIDSRSSCWKPYRTAGDLTLRFSSFIDVSSVTTLPRRYRRCDSRHSDSRRSLPLSEARMSPRPFGADQGINERIMNQELFSLRDETGASEGSPKSAPARRRSRPLTRMQEIAVLAVAFAVGAALQVAYVLHVAPTP